MEVEKPAKFWRASAPEAKIESIDTRMTCFVS